CSGSSASNSASSDCAACSCSGSSAANRRAASAAWFRPGAAKLRQCGTVRLREPDCGHPGDYADHHRPQCERECEHTQLGPAAQGRCLSPVQPYLKDQQLGSCKAGKHLSARSDFRGTQKRPGDNRPPAAGISGQTGGTSPSRLGDGAFATASG